MDGLIPVQLNPVSHHGKFHFKNLLRGFDLQAPEALVVAAAHSSLGRIKRLPFLQLHPFSSPFRLVLDSLPNLRPSPFFPFVLPRPFSPSLFSKGALKMVS